MIKIKQRSITQQVTSYLGLGSNLDKPRQQVLRALTELAATPGISVIRTSSLYLTKPVGYTQQPNFINAVVKISTYLSPYELFTELMAIEYSHGRIRTTEKNGPRTLDLDILLYGDLEINTQDLIIPHPRMWEREFVLQPLFELMPEIIYEID